MDSTCSLARQTRARGNPRAGAGARTSVVGHGWKGGECGERVARVAAVELPVGAALA